MERPFNFEIPEELEQSIRNLEEGIKNKVTYIDCLQDEVHADCRCLDDIEQQREIIQYYCNRRWVDPRECGLPDWLNESIENFKKDPDVYFPVLKADIEKAELQKEILDDKIIFIKKKYLEENI